MNGPTFWGAMGWGKHLMDSSYSGIMTTMNSKPLNPNIRVTPETRKDLKIIAAHTSETMLEVVARLAKQELERVIGQKKSGC
jgi:tRNA A37 threonylcarbamoyltransferase TsaD